MSEMANSTIARRIIERFYKPNSITLAGSELAPNRLRTGSELVRSSFEAGSELVRSQL